MLSCFIAPVSFTRSIPTGAATGRAERRRGPRLVQPARGREQAKQLGARPQRQHLRGRRPGGISKAMDRLQTLSEVKAQLTMAAMAQGVNVPEATAGGEQAEGCEEDEH